MTTLLESVGDIVYVGGSDNDGFALNPIFVSKNIKNFKKILNNLAVNDEDSLKIAHGILTSAVSIPNSIPKGTEIFILLPVANHDKESYVIPVDSLFLLQKVIESMVDPDIMTQDDVEEVVDFLISVDEQQIEDIFVLYGYSMKLTYEVQESELQSLITEKTHEGLKSLLECQECELN